MSIDARLLDLVVRYEEQAANGQEPTPEELCWDCLDLVPELKRHLQNLNNIQSLLDTENEKATPPPSPVDPYATMFQQGTGAPLFCSPSTQMRYGQEVFHARGGMGAVYRAQDTEIGREVALKRMQSHAMNNPVARRRFLREAEITGR